jgi:hypothetical protein
MKASLSLLRADMLVYTFSNLRLLRKQVNRHWQAEEVLESGDDDD